MVLQVEEEEAQEQQAQRDYPVPQVRQDLQAYPETQAHQDSPVLRVPLVVPVRREQVVPRERLDRPVHRV
jgi:hypothetical protein